MVEIDGSVNTGGGDIVGRDKVYQGLDVGELVEALKRAFPYGDQRPEVFRQTIARLQEYHTALYEWKELHNALDEILSAFGQFSAQVERSDAEKWPGDLASLRNLWRPVSSQVDSLLEFGASIKVIGQPFRVLADRSTTGEKWAVEVHALRTAINQRLHLGTGQAALAEGRDSFFGQVLQSTGGLLGIRPGWWTELYELTHAFGDAAYRHMHLADKKLRETANELYQLSSTNLGGG